MTWTPQTQCSPPPGLYLGWVSRPSGGLIFGWDLIFGGIKFLGWFCGFPLLSTVVKCQLYTKFFLRTSNFYAIISCLKWIIFFAKSSNILVKTAWFSLKNTLEGFQTKGNVEDLFALRKDTLSGLASLPELGYLIQQRNENCLRFGGRLKGAGL